VRSLLKIFAVVFNDVKQLEGAAEGFSASSPNGFGAEADLKLNKL